MNKLIDLFLCLLIPAVLSAQGRVSGTVTESGTGEPLTGVSVLVEGTSVGTVTDLDGHYSISIPADGILRFDCIGFKTVTTPVSGRTLVDIALEEDVEFLDEVVVVGYSVQKRRDVLGAVSKVDGSDLRKVPVSTVQQSLQGRIAGVDVTSQTGAPGAAISVRVRGTSSISSGNEPLYIVDGIPVEGALNSLSPNDIENITVLKDASSAAIYGSRATNGVVLITTRSGREGDAQVSYNFQGGVQRHGRLTPMATTAQYIQLYNEAAAADNATSVVKRPLIEGAYLKDFPDVDHLEEIFRTAPLFSHELSISGGDKKIHYLVSGSWYSQDGIIRGTGYDRISVRSNLDSQVKDWLKVGLNATGSLADNRMVSSSGDGYAGEGGSVVRYALFRNPAIPVYMADGSTYVDLPSEYYGDTAYNSFFGDGYSPEGLTEYTDRASKTKSLIASAYLTVNFTQDLFWKTTGGIDYRDNRLRVFNRTWGTANRINASNSLEVAGTADLGWTVNSTLNHSVSFGEHWLNYLVGAEAVRHHEDYTFNSDSQFSSNDPDLLYIGLGTGTRTGNQTESASSLLSFFANANYHYKGRYYLSGIVRRDGSSRFSKGNRWGTFYSLSAGWNMEDEAFLKDVSWLDKLKVRAGYGSIGNQDIGLYAYSDRYSGQYWYMFGGMPVDGYAQTTLGNDQLKWETSDQFNAGVDIEVLGGSLGLTVDYYYKVTRDMLVQESLPLSVGRTETPWVNNGSVLNTGVDLELTWRRQFHDWGFDVTLNGGYLHNEVLSLQSPILGARVDTGIYATRTEVGHPIGAFYLYQVDGIFQNETDIMLSAYQGSGIRPGDVKYADVSGPDGTPDGIIDSHDRVYMGSAIPRFTTGLTLAADYHRWDFSVFFQGAFGQKIFSQVNYDIEGFYRGFNVTRRYYENHWTGEGTSDSQPRASWSAKSNNVRASSRFLEDGSYLRLKNVQAGYTLALPERWKVSNLRVYAAATNLFTLTGYDGLDPEMTVSTNSAAEGDRANGIDWGTYPVAMSFTLGFNLTF
ncbi:MAG: TonB-dependent receptor [Bacteroidales bacterium]|nr:TonB-dependent receptor [Bacteroidales bacterium]